MSCGSGATPVGKCRKEGSYSFTASPLSFTAGDAFSSLASIDGATNASDKGGVITDIFIQENNPGTLLKNNFDLFICKKAFTATAIDAAFAVDATLTNSDIIGRLSVVSADYMTNPDGNYAMARITPNLPFMNSADSTLYYQMVIMETENYSGVTANMTVKFLIDRD